MSIIKIRLALNYPKNKKDQNLTKHIQERETCETCDKFRNRSTQLVSAKPPEKLGIEMSNTSTVRTNDDFGIRSQKLFKAILTSNLDVSIIPKNLGFLHQTHCRRGQEFEAPKVFQFQLE